MHLIRRIFLTFAVAYGVVATIIFAAVVTLVVALSVYAWLHWLASKVEPADSPLVQAFIEATELVPAHEEFTIDNSVWFHGSNVELVKAELDEAGFGCGSNGFTCQRAWFTVSGPCFWFVTITTNENLIATDLVGSWEGNCLWLR